MNDQSHLENERSATSWSSIPPRHQPEVPRRRSQAAFVVQLLYKSFSSSMRTGIFQSIGDSDVSPDRDHETTDAVCVVQKPMVHGRKLFLGEEKSVSPPKIACLPWAQYSDPIF